MSYYLARTVSQPFGAVIEAITARLKDQGFGVLTDINIQATLKAKLTATATEVRKRLAAALETLPG